MDSSEGIQEEKIVNRERESVSVCVSNANPRFGVQKKKKKSETHLKI